MGETYAKQQQQNAERDFHSMVEALAEMEPNMPTTERMSAVRKMAPTTFGQAFPDRPQAFDTPEQAIVAAEWYGTYNGIAQRDGISKHEAMRKARVEHPELYAKLNGVPEPVQKATAGHKKDFDLEVEGEVARTGCDRSTAMSRVRRRKPSLVEAMNKEAPVTKTKDLAGVRTSDRPQHPGERAKQQWLAAVEKTRLDYRCSNTEALQRTRAAEPGLFAAYQGVGGGYDVDQPMAMQPDHQGNAE